LRAISFFKSRDFKHREDFISLSEYKEKKTEQKTNREHASQTAIRTARTNASAKK